MEHTVTWYDEAGNSSLEPFAGASSVVIDHPKLGCGVQATIDQAPIVGLPDMRERMDEFTEDWCETIGDDPTCTKHNQHVDICHGLVAETDEF